MGCPDCENGEHSCRYCDVNLHKLGPHSCRLEDIEDTVDKLRDKIAADRRIIEAVRAAVKAWSRGDNATECMFIIQDAIEAADQENDQ